jgi:hypothetical protein
MVRRRDRIRRIGTAVDGRSMEAWLADATNRQAARPSALTPMRYAIVRDGAPLSVEVT